MTGGERERRRKQQVARNETLFREVNERLREGSSDRAGDAMELLCECGDAECTETFRATVAEYESVRADPVLFAILPGHVIPEVETVVERTDRYDVVRKDTEEQAIARATDPRA